MMKNINIALNSDHRAPGGTGGGHQCLVGVHWQAAPWSARNHRQSEEAGV